MWSFLAPLLFFFSTRIMRKRITTREDETRMRSIRSTDGRMAWWERIDSCWWWSSWCGWWWWWSSWRWEKAKDPSERKPECQEPKRDLNHLGSTNEKREESGFTCRIQLEVKSRCPLSWLFREEKLERRGSFLLVLGLCCYVKNTWYLHRFTSRAQVTFPQEVQKKHDVDDVDVGSSWWTRRWWWLQNFCNWSFDQFSSPLSTIRWCLVYSDSLLYHPDVRSCAGIGSHRLHLFPSTTTGESRIHRIVCCKYHHHRPAIFTSRRLRLSLHRPDSFLHPTDHSVDCDLCPVSSLSDVQQLENRKTIGKRWFRVRESQEKVSEPREQWTQREKRAKRRNNNSL